MNKLLIGTAILLTMNLCCAKENCELQSIDDEKYKASFATTYNFYCTGVKGYDYVDHEVLVKFNSIDAIFSSYYIDGVERKLEVLNYEEIEKKNGDVEFIGYKGITLYDEFHIEMKGNYYNTSYENMEKTLLNKWNKLKKYIRKAPKIL